jgi:hypothetical protein
MDIAGIEKVVIELKDFHLIGSNRVVKSDPKIYCNFSAGNAIAFDPNASEFMSEGAVIWLLLHEEAHLIFPQKRQLLPLPRLIIYMLLTFFTITAISILKIIPQKILSSPFMVVIAVILFLIIWGLGFYIEKNLFFQRYVEPFYSDEFKSDEYGLMGLFIVRPNLIGWQEAYSALESFKKCKEKRGELKFFRAQIRKITSYTHPPNDVRARHLKEIFEKYQRNKQLPQSSKK